MDNGQCKQKPKDKLAWPWVKRRLPSRRQMQWQCKQKPKDKFARPLVRRRLPSRHQPSTEATMAEWAYGRLEDFHGSHSQDLLPKYRKNIPISTRIRSTALLFKFFSRNTSAPQRKDTMTLPRLTIDTMEIIESG